MKIFNDLYYTLFLRSNTCNTNKFEKEMRSTVEKLIFEHKMTEIKVQMTIIYLQI